MDFWWDCVCTCAHMSRLSSFQARELRNFRAEENLLPCVSPRRITKRLFDAHVHERNHSTVASVEFRRILCTRYASNNSAKTCYRFFNFRCQDRAKVMPPLLRSTDDKTFIVLWSFDFKIIPPYYYSRFYEAIIYTDWFFL